MSTAPARTAGLLNLQAQLSDAFPNRVKPDGWIGDAAHRGHPSSHNPDDTPGSLPEWDGDPDTVPEVRGLDVAADLGDGVTGLHLVRHLPTVPGLAAVIRYMIHRGLLYHFRNGFDPVKYEGSDPHTEHVHITMAFTQAADNNTSFNYRLGEIPVPLTDPDKAWLRETMQAIVDQRVGDVVQRYDADGQPLPPSDPNPKMTAASALGFLGRDAGDIKTTLARVEAALATPAKKA